jgi:DNA repair protein RadD
MELRTYQSDLTDRIDAAIETNQGVILQLASGGGKTHTAAALTKKRSAPGQRILFVCHRREILDQASAIFSRYGIEHGIIAAGRVMDRGHLVQLALVGSLPRRSEGLDPDLIIFDEYHHISAPSWQKIANEFPNAKRLGLTATPSRLDRRPLTPIFTEIVHGPSVRSLISNGYLSEFQYFRAVTPRSVAGESQAR